MTVKIEGLAALDRALGELPKTTGKAVLRRTAREALKPFLERVQALAPRVTGALQLSYSIGARLTRRQARMVRREGKSSIEMYAGSNDPGGVSVEFGTVDTAAQPHARPAWEATQDEVLASIKEKLWAEIQKSAARLAKKAGR